MFPSSSPSSTSQASSKPPTASRFSAFAVPRRRLSKRNREDAAGAGDNLSLTRTTSSNMVDAHPAHTTSSGRPMSQGKASFFNNFSFRGRTNSNSSPSTTPHSSQLLSVKESSSSDEFGTNRQRPLASNSTTSSSAHNGLQHPNQPSSPPLQQQQQQPPPPPQPQGPLKSSADAGGQSRQLHPEIRSVVQLSNAHARKVYMSGELIKHIERLTDGKSVGKDEPWKRVWAQLGGTTLSVWDMEEIEEASRKGTEVPPTYINITDASIHVLGAVTMPRNSGPPVKYSNVVTLTTAGLNLLLFSCPNPQALIAWTAALRLSAYEKLRLEEIYTAHLLRMSLSENGAWKDPRSPLSNGRLEGWVTIRISGQTEWKRLWMCVQAGPGLTDPAGASDTMKSKNRMSTLFNRNPHEHSSSITSLSNVSADGGPRPAYISLFTSQKPRDRKKPVLTLSAVSQLFAVYPERPELISRSTLIKMEGFIGDEELAGEWRNREGWLLMMPESEAGKLGSLEMLKWLVALHDAFGIGGRPTAYSWNPRDPNSLMFAYPVGPLRDNLFLDRELAEGVDPREDRGSVVRQRFKEILIDRMYGQDRPQPSPPNGSASSPPLLPPIQSISERPSEEDAAQRLPSRSFDSSSFQLPPLSFDSGSTPANQIPPLQRQGHSLSPVTEKTEDASHSQSRGSTQDHVHSPPSATASMRVSGKPSTITEEGIVNDQLVESPVGSVPPPDSNQTITASPQRPTTIKSESTGPRSPLPPRFSQDSASMPMSAVSRAGSNVQSSESEYSQPAAPLYGNQQLMSNNVVKPASPSREAERMPPPSSQPSSANQRASLQLQQHKAEEQQPPTPTSVMTHVTTMTSPFSIHEGGRNSMGARPPPPPEKDIGRYKQGARESWEPRYEHKTQEESGYVFDEPGALYYVQQQQDSGLPPVAQAQRKSGEGESESDKESESSENSNLTNPMSLKSANPTAPVQQQPSRLSQVQQAPVQTSPVSSPIARRSTPMGFELISGSVGTVPASVRSNSFDTHSVGNSVKSGIDNQAQQQANLTVASSGSARGLGRRPSGARELPSRAARGFVASGSGSPRQAEAAGLSSSPPPPPPQQYASVPPPPPEPERYEMGAENDDGTVDALAALSFLDQQDEPSTAAPAKAASSAARAASPTSARLTAPQILEPEDRASTPPNADVKKQYRSSFAPSRQAEERKARSMAQQAMHDEAVHKPGRPNGKPKAKQQRENAWESSEDEEEEEEEDEEDGDSDEDPRAPSRGARSASSNNPSIAAPAARNPIYQQQMNGLSPSGSSVDVRDQQGQGRSRTLPQIPQRGRSPADSERRFTDFDSSRERSGSRPQSQYPPQGPYPQQQYPQQYPQQQQPQQQQQQQQQLLPQPHPGPANMRQSMWSTVLDANRNTGVPQPPQTNSNNRDTFVQMEPPAATMTKAFTPQGLLSAGLQDKQERSAKRQEEMARESGASLVNVPNKPPPPQVGLLGAITAHEREKKREGGIGATLTEREREKRLAEDRQRRLDDLQRQQLEQQQAMAAQFGGMYGQGLSPQMTGMNPMMSGGFGYNPMQSMYFNPMMMNPQHMFAAQQAAAAYQQAMYAMSAAGSQIGDNTGNNNNNGAGTPGGPSGSPNMRPNSSGGLPPPQMMGGGFDPRMSMMGMPMMGMGMGGGMPMQMPMGMQMTGQSGMPMGGMDPRMSMGPNTFDQMSQWGGMMGSTGPLATPPPGGSGPSSQRLTPFNESPADSTAAGPSRTGTGEDGAR